jgi:hypothetical protein
MIGAVAILVRCAGAVNQPDVSGIARKRRRSRSEKGPPMADFLHRGAAGMAILRS